MTPPEKPGNTSYIILTGHQNNAYVLDTLNEISET